MDNPDVLSKAGADQDILQTPDNCEVWDNSYFSNFYLGPDLMEDSYIVIDLGCQVSITDVNLKNIESVENE